MELQSALHETDTHFSAEYVTALKEIIQDSTPTTQSNVPEAVAVQIQATNLEQAEYDYDMEKLKHDEGAYNILEIKKAADAQANVFHQKLAHKQRCYQAGHEAACSLFDEGQPHQRVPLKACSRFACANAVIDSFASNVQKYNRLSSVTIMMYVNWSCTSVVTSSAQKMQGQLIS